MTAHVKLRKSAEQKRLEKLAEILLFCPCCFASSEGGSWTNGQAAFEDLCINCGASGPNLKMPRWAVDSIRRQASWVGKRYYAHEEDKENYEELMRLRATIKVFPGRTATLAEDGESWWVTQELGGGRNVSITVDLKDAKTKEAALEKARLALPYVP